MTNNVRNNKLILNKLEEIAYFLDTQEDKDCMSSKARVKSLTKGLIEHFRDDSDLLVLIRNTKLTNAINEHKELSK